MVPSMSDSDKSAEEQERERDELLKRLLKTPPQPRPKRERDQVERLEFVVIDGKLRVAGNVRHGDDGSITADVYRNLEDYRAGRAMERAATYSR